MPRSLPSGTVTFLFTDVEGSTRLLHALGAEAYADALATHRSLLREAFTRHGGIEVDTQGDAFFVAFPTAPGALAAAMEAREALASGPIRVRMGLHTGTPLLDDEGYIGPDVHKGARIAAAGHGGQVLVSAATAELVDGAELRDLGLHRLKDLAEPARIFQADRDEHPALKSLHQTNLPVPATPFLGRAVEVVDVRQLIARDGTRLVTLTGPGGTGKTRLALQAAAEAADDFPGGVWWVPLAALRDPALVLSTAATALGASGELAEYMGDKHLLLLFDNFEHLTSAAPELAALMRACPNLKLLVTSRQPLHLAGEHEYVVDPLTRSDAVELFLTRALAAKRDVAGNDAIARICERLDDLPLAIELAAARVKILSPQALLGRLEQRLPLLAGGARDLPERQRTLRATIEWSHELLTDGERRLFARLAVFRGGCTLEAAEGVVEADLDTLQSLVDKSLVRVRDIGRFSMLETIREFAVERLEAWGDADQLRRRHAKHFLALAEEAEPHLRGDPKAWLDRLEAELDNLRAAQDWFDRAADGSALQRLAGALWRFYATRGYVTEGRRRMEEALRAPSVDLSTRVRASHGATALALDEDLPTVALERAEDALALSTKLGDEWLVAQSLQLLGNVHAHEGRFSSAKVLFEQALARFRPLGDEHYVLLQIRLIAWMHFELGNREAATALHREVVERARASGNRRMQQTSLGALGEYALEERNVTDAVPHLREAWDLARDMGERVELVVGLARYARALAIQGHFSEAACVFAAGDALREEVGAAPIAWLAAANAETMDAIRAHLDDGEAAQAAERGRRLSPDDAAALTLSTLGFSPGAQLGRGHRARGV